jgi:hypothetical protein
MGREALEPQSAFRPLLHPTGIWICTEMDIRGVRNLIFGAVLRRIDMVARASGAFDQSGINDRCLRGLQLQPVALKLAADLGQ